MNPQNAHPYASPHRLSHQAHLPISLTCRWVPKKRV